MLKKLINLIMKRLYVVLIDSGFALSNSGCFSERQILSSEQ